MPAVGVWIILVRIWDRVSAAFRLLRALVTQRDRSRSLPWPHIRRRLKRDPACLAAIVSIATSLMIFPTWAALEGQDHDLSAWFGRATLIGWAASAFVIFAVRQRAMR